MRIELTHVVVGPRGDRRARCEVPQLEVPAGTALCVRGPSGSGKSTLLDLVSGVLVPSEGQVVVGDVDLTTLSPRARDRYRKTHVAHVFQTFNVLGHLTAVENVALALSLRGAARGRAREEARAWLDRVDLAPVDAPCRTLSVGERQRVALARALACEPAVLLADEPTASLDAARRDAFLEHLEHRPPGTTLLVATHDDAVALHFDERLDIPDVMHWSEA